MDMSDFFPRTSFQQSWEETIKQRVSAARSQHLKMTGRKMTKPAEKMYQELLESRCCAVPFCPSSTPEFAYLDFIVDRIEHGEGYFVDNMQCLCRFHKYGKQGRSMEEFQAFQEARFKLVRAATKP